MKSRLPAKLLVAGTAIGLVTSVAVADNPNRDSTNPDMGAVGSEYDAAVKRDEKRDQTTMLGDTRANQVHPDDAQEVRALLGDVVDAALEGDINEIAGYLAKNDRERIKNAENVTELDNIGDRIGDAWRTKYNQTLGFDQSSQELAAVFPEVMPGQDKKHISVTLPESGGTLRLVDEGMIKTTWRLDIPDNMSAQEITQALRR